MKEQIKVCCEHEWVLKEIERVSNKYLTKLTDPTKIEDRCISKIGKYLLVSKEHPKHTAYIKKSIEKEFYDAVGKYKTEESIRFSELTENNDYEEEIEFEPEDVLANVEDEVITKEMAALLAQDDRRKKVILGSWLDGNRNNASISRFLAKTLGGNEETHRKSINRFRLECREYVSEHFAAI